MASSSLRARGRLDGVGVMLSGVCAVHCVAGLVIVAGLGLSGGFLLDPAIHRVGLALAALIAALAIGMGAVRHRRPVPLLVALTGLGSMGAALAVGHGVAEVVLTVAGVTLVAAGHLLNLRPHRRRHWLPKLATRVARAISRR